MVVPGKHQGGAVLSRAGHVGVAQDITGTIDSGSLAVPDSDHPIDLCVSDGLKNLAAHHSGGRQVFVHARMKVDLVFLEQLLGSSERQVIAAQRRAFIAGNEGSGVETGAAIAAHLVHRQPDEGLNAREVNTATLDRIFVGEAHGLMYRSTRVSRGIQGSGR